MANAKANDVTELPAPNTDPSTSGISPINIEVMAWNAQMTLMYANGGPSTTAGSLMEKYGVNLNISRQDDYGQMQNDLVAFANDVKGGNEFPGDKKAFVIIMGDAGAQFFAGLNPMLQKLGNDYIAQGFVTTGYSYGEDKLMGDPEWKRNPQKMKGCIIAGVIRDGDWDIAMKFCADNGIKNNPDEATYDPDAVNWVAADNFLDAAAKYIGDFPINDRPIIKDGKLTGETAYNLHIKGVVTWTPGDVNIAEQRGGLAVIVSTKEYSAQMTAEVIGLKPWMQSHRKLVEGFVHALGDAGDQLKSYPNALQRSAEIEAAVYKDADKDASYWAKYYIGVPDGVDKQGMPVSLGGSKSNNLADNVLLFGPNKLYAAVYTAFGNIVVQQYPKLYKTFPPADQVIDGSYVMDVARETQTTMKKADKFTFNNSPYVKAVVGKRKYNILFATGSATIAGGQESILEDLEQQLAVATALKVVIHGHTDNVGTAELNKTLSEARATSVKRWLESTYPDIFPSNRITVVAHGQSNPVADNSTESGRAQNRRVEIVTGTSE